MVAQDIALELPQGERYALIGPNGAGKTTLMNLMTGMLRPDSGRFSSAARRSPRYKPDARVKKGLARTFQINTLFPQLSALESVTLAVLEREGQAHNWWRALPRFGAAIDEAQGILHRSDWETSHSRDHANWRTASSACSRSRSRSPRARRCCCSTSPRPACRRTRARALFDAIDGLSRSLTILFIEHDMDVVFRFASRIIVMVGGRILVEGPPDEIARDERVREVYLGKRPRARCLS